MERTQDQNKSKKVAIAIAAIVAAVIAIGHIVKVDCPSCHGCGKMATNLFHPTPFPVRRGTCQYPLLGTVAGWYRIADGQFFLNDTVYVSNCGRCDGDGKVSWRSTW